MWWMAMLRKGFFSWNFIKNCNACSTTIIVDIYTSTWITWTNIETNNITMPKANKVINWTNEINKNMLNKKQLHANGFSFKDKETIILE